jgi:hypothetical protein
MEAERDFMNSSTFVISLMKPFFLILMIFDLADYAASLLNLSFCYGTLALKTLQRHGEV